MYGQHNGYIEDQNCRFTALTFFVSVAQQALTIARLTRPDLQNQESYEEQNRGQLVGGFYAFVGLRATLDKRKTSIPFMPIVDLVRDENGINTAQFNTVDSLKCSVIAAEFVLSLQPPLLMDPGVVDEITQITGIPMSVTNQVSLEPLHRLLLRQHNQEALASVDVHMVLPNKSQHLYHLNTSPLRGYSVSEVAFTCTNQLPALIKILRRQAAWLSFAESFLLHPRNPTTKDHELTYKFDVSMPSRQEFVVSFQHPLAAQRIVKVKIELGELGVRSASVFGVAVNDSVVTDYEYYNPLRILTRSHNLPVSLTWMFLRLGCPIQKALCSMFPEAPTDSFEVPRDQPVPIAVDETPTASKVKRFRETRSDRARRGLSLCDEGEADADGVLSGADQISEENLRDAKELFYATSFSLNYDPLASLSSSTRTSYSSTPRPPPSSLPPGVMAVTPPSGYLFGQQKMDAVSSAGCAQQARSKTYSSLIMPGASSTSVLSSFHSTAVSSTVKQSSISYSPRAMASSVSSPAQTISSRPLPSSLQYSTDQSNPSLAPSTSMLVSLLDEVILPQNISPHVAAAAIPCGRMLTASSSSHSPISPSHFLNPNNSSSGSVVSTVGDMSSSDIVSHQSKQPEKDSVGMRTSRGLLFCSSIKSPKVSTTNASRAGADPTAKRIRKRKINAADGVTMSSTMGPNNPSGQFISSLPTRSFIMDTIRQPGTSGGALTDVSMQVSAQKVTPKSPSSNGTSRLSAAVASDPRANNSAQVAKSVYDFDDAPAASSMAALSRAPSSVGSSLSTKAFTISTVSSTPPMVSSSVASAVAERTTERKSEIKLVIKTNRGASASSVTSTTATVSETSLCLSKPKKIVEGKPEAFIKQMRSDGTSVLGITKKERKRRASSKKLDSGQHVILSIPPPVAAMNRKSVTTSSRKLTHSFSASASTDSSLPTKSKKRKKTTSSSLTSATPPFVVKPLPLQTESTNVDTITSLGSTADGVSYAVVPRSTGSSVSLIPSSVTSSSSSLTGLPLLAKKMKGDEVPADLDTPSKGNGLIKGYKIPKRKLPSPIPIIPSDQIPMLLDDIFDSGGLEPEVDLSSTTKPELELPVTPSSTQMTTASNSSVPVTTPVGHKSTNKKLHDIVDQLRAAKSATGPLAVVATATVSAMPPTQAVSEETDHSVNAEVDMVTSSPITSPSSPISTELTPTESTDNIFEKFGSNSTTPTKAAGNTSKLCRTFSNQLPRTPSTGDYRDSLPPGSEAESSELGLIQKRSGSSQTPPLRVGDVSDEAIKDTPDSPTESTSKPPASTSDTSKIIPVSRKPCTPSTEVHPFFNKSTSGSRSAGGTSGQAVATLAMSNARGGMASSTGPRFNYPHGSWSARSFGPGMPRAPGPGFGNRGWNVPPGSLPLNPPSNWPMRPPGLYRGDGGGARYPGPPGPPGNFMPSLPGGSVNRPLNKK